MVWQEINKQWEEEDSVGKADAGQRSGLRGLSGETGPGSEDPQWQEAPGVPVGRWPLWNLLGVLRVALNNFSWGGSPRVLFPHNFFSPV